jgi:tetratricopeptide (TPR) repeat protein
LLYLRIQAALLAQRKREGLALIETFPLVTSKASLVMAALKIQTLVELAEFEKAEEVGEQWLASAASLEDKIHICDCLVSYPLYSEKLANIKKLRVWTQKGLSLSPDNPSMKATLAAVLVESGEYPEAESLLMRRIEDSPNLQNKAFAIFYLGVLRAKQGKIREARKLIEQSTIISNAPWLMGRAKNKLAEINTLNGGSQAV